MNKIAEEAIAEIIVEIEKEHSNYQSLHRNIYGYDDESAKIIYKKMLNTCKRIRKRIIIKAQDG